MLLLNDAHRWAVLPKGVWETFTSPKPRKVHLEVNCSDPTRFFIEFLAEYDENGNPVPQGKRFLGKVDGKTPLVFVTPCAYRICHMEDDAHVMIHTRDGELQHRENLDEEAFTTLHEGPIKDPAIVAMEERMFSRMERRLALKEAELERRFERERANNMGSDEQAPVLGTTVDTPPQSDSGDTDEVAS